MLPSDWVNRAKLINQSLGILKKKKREMDKTTFIEKVIEKNLHHRYQKDFIMNDGDKKASIKEAKKILCKINCAESYPKESKKS